MKTLNLVIVIFERILSWILVPPQAVYVDECTSRMVDQAYRIRVHR